MNNTDTSLISISDSKDVTISNSIIDYKALEDTNSFGIFAYDVENLKLLNNTINYVGNTQGSNLNNAINIYSDEKTSKKIEVSGNVFNIVVPSTNVGYDEDYNSVAYSDAIVFTGCEDLTFSKNNVTLNYNGSYGSYDTIHVLTVGNSNYGFDEDYELIYPNVCTNVVISENNIISNGHTYIYGIYGAINNFEITNNKLNMTSDVHYVDAIGIDGPSSNGVVSNNVIDIEAPNMVFGIYSNPYMGAVENVNYINNTIIGDAYASCGMEIVNENPIISENAIILTGNHTTGIVANMNENGTVEKNDIFCYGSNIGNASTGDSMIHKESTGISIKGDALISNNHIYSTAIGVNLILGGKMELADNVIDVYAKGETDNYGIYADALDSLNIHGNNVTFEGITEGEQISNGVYIVDIDEALLFENNFNLNLISSYVPWDANWVSHPVSEGIVIDACDNVTFDSNAVNVTFSDIVGTFDTIYSVDFKNSNNAVITNNAIDSTGNTYIYGIIISGDDFIIRANNITSVGDYYANGIDVEGPATGVVEDNKINVKANTSAYAIYSGMNGQSVAANYTGNVIKGEAYNVFGFSSGDVESNIVNNILDLKGNYTTGIAYRGSKLVADGNRIILDSSEQGNESVWEKFGVEAVGIKVLMGNATIKSNVIAGPGKGVSIVGVSDDVVLEENFINIVAGNDKDAYAIYATDVPALTIDHNTVDYQGATNGTGKNNAVYLYNATDALIFENKFDIELVSSYVPWDAYWVAHPVSEGIVVEESNGVVFDNNNVTVTFGDVVGAYDTIYSVDFKNSNKAVITNNAIDSTGNTYIYGIQISGDDFIIRANNITSVGDYYANGIDVEGPATGVVEDNKIDVKANTSVYAIYSGMNGQSVAANYTGNVIKGEAYNVFGFSSGDVESNIVNNTVVLNGNYTTGIAYRGSKLLVDGNEIIAAGSNVGSEYVWENFGVTTIGVKVVAGNATVTNNDVTATGDYTVNVTNTNSSVHDNHLVAKELFGDQSVFFEGAAEVYNNTPTEAAEVNITSVNEVVVELPEDATGEVTVTVDGKEYAKVPVDNGTVVIPLENLENGNHEVVVQYSGDEKYAPKVSNYTAYVSAPRIDTIITVDATFTRVANDYVAGERGDFFYATLTDINGNPLANVTVQIAVNGPIYNITTDEQGRAGLRVNLAEANTYTYALSFQGNEKYNAAPLASSKLTVTKKSTSITASAKTFKAKTKTKKISVTLKTVKNKYDGKTYLNSGKKLTLKINGKTYTAKINKKGVATFSIKLTKKGKFTALIKFAGDKTYKASSKKIKVTIK